MVCAKCSEHDAFPVMPAVAKVMRDIPEDDEGAAEQSSLQRLMRVHRNLGHPPNRLLAQIFNEAKPPQVSWTLLPNLNVHFVPDMFELLPPDLQIHSEPKSLDKSSQWN